MQESSEVAPSPKGRSGPRALLDLLAWVGRDPGLTPPNKAVLLAVVALADERRVSEASDQALASASRTSIQTVQRSLLVLQGHGVLRRDHDPPGSRSIRLLTGEHSLFVDVVAHGKKQHQQQYGPGDCSPVSGPVESGHLGPVGDVDNETERLVALLAQRGISEKVARGLVKNYPERIAAQVEAHWNRKVWNVSGSLVTAIREDWPAVASQSPPSSKEQQEAARKRREAQEQAALDAKAVENARKRAEEKAVDAYWDGLTPERKDALDEEAIEASPHRDEIRSLSHCHPLHRGFRVAARRVHIRRKLGLGIEG